MMDSVKNRYFMRKRQREWHTRWGSGTMWDDGINFSDIEHSAIQYVAN